MITSSTGTRPIDPAIARSLAGAVPLSLVSSKPVPFPPEPLRSGVIQATRASIARADRNGGRRGAWLRLLDRLGLGFDS